MASNEHPQRNINYPFAKAAIDRMRARMIPPGATKAGGFQHQPPAGSKGSLREVRPGEWIDDRVIVIDGTPEPTDLDYVEPQHKRSVPGSYDSGKVYAVQLAKPVFQDGEWLSPASDYQMVGDVCTAISASIMNAEEIGDIPHDPYVDPLKNKAKE